MGSWNYHQKIDRTIYLVKENNTPVDVEPVEILFVTFDVHVPRKAPEAKVQNDKVRGKEEIQRESTLIRKEKYIDSVQNKSKNGGIIYPTGEQKWVCPIPHKYVGH